MRKALVAALGALLLTITFASEASAQRWWRGGGGWYGGGLWRAGGWGYGYRPWAYRPYRPLLWGAAALGTAAALSYASYPYYSYPRYRYGYDYPSAYSSYAYAPTYSYGYVAPSAYTGYAVPYGAYDAYAYASCGTASQLVWNGWGYRRVWVRTC
jgi:hypothetical protein